MPPSPSITWAHIGDLHADAAGTAIETLERIVVELNGPLGRGIDFVFLPGDNVNHGRSAEYRRILDALAPLSLPWRAIPGDHDIEPRNLTAYHDAIPPANRPDADVMSGHRCLFRELGDPRPSVRILASADQRLVTRPDDPRQVPRLGPVTMIAAIAMGDDLPIVRVGDGASVTTQDEGHLWRTDLDLADGLHCVTVACGDGIDAIEQLVRPADAISKRRPADALGSECPRIGTWRERSILGTRLGPNCNGGEAS